MSTKRPRDPTAPDGAPRAKRVVLGKKADVEGVASWYLPPDVLTAVIQHASFATCLAVFSTCRYYQEKIPFHDQRVRRWQTLVSSLVAIDALPNVRPHGVGGRMRSRLNTLLEDHVGLTELDLGRTGFCCFRKTAPDPAKFLLRLPNLRVLTLPRFRIGPHSGEWAPTVFQHARAVQTLKFTPPHVGDPCTNALLGDMAMFDHLPSLTALDMRWVAGSPRPWEWRGRFDRVRTLVWTLDTPYSNSPIVVPLEHFPALEEFHADMFWSTCYAVEALVRCISAVPLLHTLRLENMSTRPVGGGHDNEGRRRAAVKQLLNTVGPRLRSLSLIKVADVALEDVVALTQLESLHLELCPDMTMGAFPATAVYPNLRHFVWKPAARSGRLVPVPTDFFTRAMPRLAYAAVKFAGLVDVAHFVGLPALHTLSIKYPDASRLVCDPVPTTWQQETLLKRTLASLPGLTDLELVRHGRVEADAFAVLPNLVRLNLVACRGQMPVADHLPYCRVTCVEQDPDNSIPINWL